MWRPIINGPSDFGQRAIVRIVRLQARFTAIGSEGTAIASADLFNNIRVLTYTTPRPTGATPVNPLADITDFPNMSDVEKIIHDQIIALPTQAFDSSDYNVPMVKSGVWSKKVNILLDCRTDTGTGLSGWGTVARNLYVAHVSDSSVTPNPHLTMNWRMTAYCETY